ncbi:hypothetical protein GCHA_2317 [Paraglaciecola chathamensis S18K6]|uniref:Uncharacterized protein n=1 Tax=Paraglaciecola chathamensis S18K6 TaxID=1127672 RepID=A0AAV3UZQ8_9ALTE|nr:hypothetical protein GCHA_2317 [Paraglaciecola chathamensis S18K6]
MQVAEVQTSAYGYSPRTINYYSVNNAHYAQCLNTQIEQVIVF